MAVQTIKPVSRATRGTTPGSKSGPLTPQRPVINQRGTRSSVAAGGATLPNRRAVLAANQAANTPAPRFGSAGDWYNSLAGPEQSSFWGNMGNLTPEQAREFYAGLGVQNPYGPDAQSQAFDAVASSLGIDPATWSNARARGGALQSVRGALGDAYSTYSASLPKAPRTVSGNLLAPITTTFSQLTSGLDERGVADVISYFGGNPFSSNPMESLAMAVAAEVDPEGTMSGDELSNAIARYIKVYGSDALPVNPGDQLYDENPGSAYPSWLEGLLGDLIGGGGQTQPTNPASDFTAALAAAFQPPSYETL